MTPNNVTTETVLTPISVDLKQLVEHGEPPTALILAIAIFTAVSLDSLTKLIGGIGLILQKSNSSKSHED
jgi:hypothetical protein